MPQDKQPTARTTTQMRWEFDPDIPTHDFLDGRSLDDMWSLQEVVESLVYWLEEDRFLTWEAVVCEEQGIALTPEQKLVMGGLLDFNEDEDEDEDDEGEDDRILYIDGIERPSEPWHVILNRIVPHLLIEPFRTSDVQSDVKCDGWPQIVAALHKHGQGLSLPPGVESAKGVVPVELQHKLGLQSCFDDLSGLGQEGVSTLEDPESHYRIEDFIDHLREFKESVAYFGLTLDSLLTRVVLPERDRPIFVSMMQERLGLNSAHERIADRLSLR